MEILFRRNTANVLINGYKKGNKKDMSVMFGHVAVETHFPNTIHSVLTGPLFTTLLDRYEFN